VNEHLVEQTEAIRVLVADEKHQARALIRRLVENDQRFTVVAEASSWPETIERIDLARPDAVILDVGLPGMEGLDAIPVIAGRSPQARILALTGPQTPPCDELRQRGVHDCLPMESGVAELLKSLEDLFPDLAPPSPAIEAQPVPVRSGVDEILSLLVHEIQAPLAVIEGFTLALQAAVERDDDDGIRETSQGIRRAGASLRALIRSFAEVGAMESGILSLNLREAPIVQLVNLTVEDLTTLAASHTIVIDAHDDFVAEVDSIRIRQVLTNLLTNAVKFSPRRSEITIRVRRDEETVRISVSDQGPGIPAHSHGELFQKFSRLGATGSGTGLGLYLSRGIARAHGGDLICDSRAGQGATFTLSVPLKQEGAARS
jgi:signal transduction histidine kinase